MASDGDEKRPADQAAAREHAVRELGPALQSLGRSMRRSRWHEAVLSEAGVDIDRAGLAVLGVLLNHTDGLRLTEIAEELRIEAPAVTRKVQQLERLGLVARAHHPDDRRSTILALTPAGHDSVTRMFAARGRWLTRLLADWPVSEQTELARLLRRFALELDRNLENLDG